MNANDCTECNDLSQRTWELYAELSRSQDELTITSKNSAEYRKKKADVLRLQGLVKEVRSRSNGHQQTHRR